MRQNDRSLTFRMFLPVLVGLVLATGCAGPMREPVRPSAPEALRILAVLSQRNAGLNTYKGIGDILLKEGEKRFSGRAVWAAADRNKLRVELLAATGQPVLRFAYNGEWVTVQTMDPERYLKRRADAASLERLTKLPIPVADTVSLLAGRPPIRRYDRADVTKAVVGEDINLILEQDGKVVEKILIQNSGLKVRSVEMFKPGGNLLYGVSMEKNMSVEGFDLPEKLVFWNARQDLLTLLPRRTWINTAISPGLFMLEKTSSEDN